MMTFSRHNKHSSASLPGGATKRSADDIELEMQLAKLPTDVWWAERQYQRAVQMWSAFWDMYCLGVLELKEDVLLEYLTTAAVAEKDKHEEENDDENMEEQASSNEEADKAVAVDETGFARNDKESSDVVGNDDNPQDAVVPKDNNGEAQDKDETKPVTENDMKDDFVDANQSQDANDKSVPATVAEKEEESTDKLSKEGSPKPPLIAVRDLLHQMEGTEAQRRVDVAQKLKDWVKGQERLLVGAEAATKLAWLDWTTSGASEDESENTEDDKGNNKDEKEEASKGSWLWKGGGGSKDEDDNDAAETNKGDSKRITDDEAVDSKEKGSVHGNNPAKDSAARGESSATATEANASSDMQSISALTEEELQQRRLQVQEQVKEVLAKKWGATMAMDWLQATQSAADDTLYVMDDVFGLDAYLESPHVVSAAVGEWWQVKRPPDLADGNAETPSNTAVNTRNEEEEEEEPEHRLALVIISSGPQMHLFNLPNNQVVLDLETPPHDAMYELLTMSSSSTTTRHRGFPTPSLSLPMADAQVNLTEEMDTMEIIPPASTEAPCIRLLSPHLNNIY